MAGAGSFRRSASMVAFRAWQAIQMAKSRGSSTDAYVPCLTFAPGQDKSGEQRIGPLCNELQEKGKLFYGIEILARTSPHKGPLQLDFNDFMPVLPVFVSVVWHSRRFGHVEPIGQVESLQLCKLLKDHIPAMPHITGYQMTMERMNDFLDLGVNNLLALRGDDVEKDQVFANSVDMAQFVKCKKGDKVSISVAGFPDGYSPCLRTPEDMAKNLELMKAKIDAGADCIITQMCYKSEALIKYAKDCRASGIKVPILIGIMAHDTYFGYKNMLMRGEAELPPELDKEIEKLQCQFLADPEKNKDLIIDFFVRVNVKIISEVLAACDDVWGVVFFTLNRFDNVHRMLKELHKLDLFKKP